MRRRPAEHPLGGVGHAHPGRERLEFAIAAPQIEQHGVEAAGARKRHRLQDGLGILLVADAAREHDQERSRGRSSRSRSATRSSPVAGRKDHVTP
jgi:hypothetical protein